MILFIILFSDLIITPKRTEEEMKQFREEFGDWNG